MIRTIICLSTLLAAGLAAADDVLFHDDFTADSGRYELSAAKPWRVAGGAMHFKVSAGEAFAVVNVDERDRLHVEADIRPERRLSSGFPLAGLTVFLDRENHWRLLLVASPDNRLYFELTERRGGVHQAQGVAGPTRLAARQEGQLRAWQYGHDYHLTLILSAESISGEVRDPGSGQFWRCSYALTSGHAVREGRPGLWAGGLEGTFAHLAVQAPPLPAEALLPLAQGPAGSVAIVDDEHHRVAPALAELLRRENYGVTTVAWADLAQKRLPAESLDVLILADARRVPAPVAQLTTRLLRAQGRVIAVGAPAFGELLCRLGSRYVPVERFAEELYPRLDRRPLLLDAKQWKRSSQNAKQAGSIEAVGVEKLRAAAAATPVRPVQAWKISSDLQGWDVFSQPAGSALADGRTVLCFQARGDDHTPQLAVECIEHDGARYMATVELTARLRSFVLRPIDFTYWRDSKAAREPGQRLNPAAVERIIFGLSASHTPRCKPGPHALVIQDIATAVDPQAEEPEVHVPEIEGLCPSYKLYPLDGVTRLGEVNNAASAAAAPPAIEPWTAAGYAPVTRPTGLGFDRQRAMRQVRFLDAYDAAGADRGSLVWLMLGDHTWPGAVWAGVGLADPTVLARSARAALAGKADDSALAESFLRLVHRMTRGLFLLEGGSRQFAYERDEPIELGAAVVNTGRREQTVDVALSISNGGTALTRRTATLTIPPHQRRQATWDWRPRATDWDAFPATVTTELMATDARPAGQTAGQATGQASPPAACDRIEHPIALLTEGPADRDEFVTVDGSRFVLGGKTWYAKGMNYWPNAQGGLATVHRFQRDQYDPAVIERDLTWMQAQGINFLSGIQAPQFDKEDGPAAYRDLQDFLNRCRNHQMKVFYFLRCDPFAGGTAAQAIQQISAAGIKNHPAVLAWELSWEPIYYSGPRGGGMDFLIADWNDWIAEQYGDLAAAEAQWKYQLPRLESGAAAAKKPGQRRSGPTRMRHGESSLAAVAERQALPAAAATRVAVPPYEWFQEHGPWDGITAAFRRFFSDCMGRGYGSIIRPLREYDPNHLITFRFGACGIPNKAWFAHAHSAGVARHVDFLCPEGYNLQKAQGVPTEPDEIRKGGLTTLYYRWLGREKPVVWMEFGYTVGGMHTPWKNAMVRVDPAQLAAQRTEFASFYSMFIESGAQGAAPWWLPGGFRLDEQSDFGLLEPDESPRPACGVIREFLAKFDRPIPTCVLPADAAARDATRPVLQLDFDAHYADAWDTWAPQYLQAVVAGHLPYVTTAGTNTTSATCPLLAVGGREFAGHGPLAFLNAELDRVEIQELPGGPWRAIVPGETIACRRGATLRCRAALGNTGEATWLAHAPLAAGQVLLSCNIRNAQAAPITSTASLTADTPYLADVDSEEFPLVLLDDAAAEQLVTLRPALSRKAAQAAEQPIPFGQRYRFKIRLIP